MEMMFSCPACASDAWEDVGTHLYWRVEHEPGGIWHSNEEVRARRQVLFEVWFPQADCVTLKSRRCQICGTVCWAPRPTEAELTWKYNFLREARASSPASFKLSPIADSDAARATAIHDLLAPCVESPAKVLDVGGGDGRLMTAFAQRGFECFLVDQVDSTHPFVKKLGDRVSEVSAELSFDAAVCSHVLEHVSSPRELLAFVCDRLRVGGAVYIEVPWEVFHSNAWNPISAEPVEHISFFTCDAIERMLHGTGFSVLSVVLDWSSYEGEPLPVIKAVGIKPETAPSVRLSNSARPK